jgi:predicted anti-sigma-YlaC factor YlaD
MQKPFGFTCRREGFRGNVVKVRRSCASAPDTKSDEVYHGGTRSNLNVVSILTVTIIAVLCSGCIKRLAVNSIASALTESSADVYARDDDPTLVGQALPFALKTMESLLEQTPNNKKLLISTAAGFVQYAHAYVLQPTNRLESIDLSAARDERQRAKRLFLRARQYGLRALELDFPGIANAVVANGDSTLSHTKPEDVPALYWTGIAWGSAISVAKDDMVLVSEVPSVRALLDRTLALDPDWENGAVHEFFIRFDASRTEAEGGGIAKAEQHFKRAMELNNGRSVGPLVAFAEAVCVQEQDRDRFKALLHQALAFDPDEYPEKRLSNLLAQKRAGELLEDIDELFYLDESDQETTVHNR